MGALTHPYGGRGQILEDGSQPVRQTGSFEALQSDRCRWVKKRFFSVVEKYQVVFANLSFRNLTD